MHTTVVAEIVPHSLADAPSVIERVWPVQKISVEAQKERKAGSGQTLTALASYWKGRKPLVLVRACVLGALLPATDDAARDLEVFEALMSMDDASFAIRDVKSTPDQIASLALESGSYDQTDVDAAFNHRNNGRLQWKKDLDVRARMRMTASALAMLPYNERVARSLRPEELDQTVRADAWPMINAHLGTAALSIQELVEQLGIMRFGHRPKVADVFAGGGSIPFESARIGCDVHASDLNPVACMLTWGALNIVGATPEDRAALQAEQRSVIDAVDRQIVDLGIEHDDIGRRAKVYLYCLDVTDPATGWTIPLLPNLLVSKSRKVVAKLVPNHETRTIDIEIVSDASAEEMKAAEQGTITRIRNVPHVVYSIDGVDHIVSLPSIRGDYKTSDGNRNRLRHWDKDDFVPRSDDVLRERLYCIQWCSVDGRSTVFDAPTVADVERERRVEQIVTDHLSQWQADGHVADMRIEPGDKTDEPIRTRGWTHWHHLFSARDILTNALIQQEIAGRPHAAMMRCMFAKTLDYSSRIASWAHQIEAVTHTFSNQALNTFYNWPSRALEYRMNPFVSDRISDQPSSFTVKSLPAANHAVYNDIYITDPPYADAVHYHEITEFFISWLRGNPPAPFDDLVWDSRRSLAIKGDGDDFRRGMIDAYRAMADHMPDNGMQIVMFTHQSDAVFADMARIFIAAGLRVEMAWYIATETTSELKQGGFVQGTVILVLRKRLRDEYGFKGELARDIADEVERQIADLTGLNQSGEIAGRVENMFSDADLRMAGYAAALRVITSYTDVEGVDIPAAAMRPRSKGEKDVVDDLVELATVLSTESLVPDGIPSQLWKRMEGPERFYLQMLHEEGQTRPQLAVFQNNAKVFRAGAYQEMMGDVRPNTARLKTAAEFKRSAFDLPGFGRSLTRAVLYAMCEIEHDTDAVQVANHLHENIEDYPRRRADAIEIAEFIARRRSSTHPVDARTAWIVADLMRHDRV